VLARQRGLTRGQVADWHETVAITLEDVRWAVIAKLTAGRTYFVPVPGSAHAAYALDEAADIARSAETGLTVMTCVPDPFGGGC
jgi:hypothetical protein